MQRWFVSWVVSTLVVAFVCVMWFDDVHWVAPTALFWIVVVAASLCVVTALGVAALALRSDQAELGSCRRSSTRRRRCRSSTV